MEKPSAIPSDDPKRPKKPGPPAGCVLLGIGAVLLVAAGLFYAGIETWKGFRAKKALEEIYSNFHSIDTAQRIFKSEHGKFGGSFTEIQWRPEGKRRYTYYMCGDVRPPSQGDPLPLPPGMGAACDDQHYLVIAVANLDTDQYPDVWTIDQDRQFEHPYNDMSDSGTDAR